MSNASQTFLMENSRISHVHKHANLVDSAQAIASCLFISVLRRLGRALSVRDPFPSFANVILLHEQAQIRAWSSTPNHSQHEQTHVDVKMSCYYSSNTGKFVMTCVQ